MTCMHVSCLFVICIIIKDNDNQYNTEQSNLFDISMFIHGSKDPF